MTSLQRWSLLRARTSVLDPIGLRDEGRAYLVAIVGVTLCGLGLRLIFANGPIGSDDGRYFAAAETIVRGLPITNLDHAASRLIFLLIVGAPGVLAGSIFVSGIVNASISVLGQVVASTFAYRQFGPRAGLVVAIILALDGLAITYSGMLLPDDLLSLFCLLCAICAYCGSLAPPGRSLAWLAAAGVAAGLAYSTKDTGILLIVPVVAFLLAWSSFGVWRRVALSLFFLVSFAAVWAIEGLFYASRAGDFLYRTHAVALVHNASITPADGLIDFLRHGWWNLASTGTNAWLAAIPLVVGVAAWLNLLVKRDESTVFALIGGFVSAFLFFGTSSLTRLVNLPFQERYFIPLLPFIAIAIAISVNGFWSKWSPRQTTVIFGALTLACFLGGTTAAAKRSGTLYFAEGLRNAALAVRLVPNDGQPIYASQRTRSALGAYLAQPLLARLQAPPAAPDARGGYYLLLLRDGTPLWPDSSITTSDLRSVYLSVGLSQRRVDSWYPVPRRIPRDSAVVYGLGQR